MRSSAARKREDDAQLNVWQFIAPAPTDDVRNDLVELMKVMARHSDLFGTTIGEAVFAYERDTGRVVGQDPENPTPREQRATSWLARVPKIAGLKPTGDFRRSPVKRHHGSLHRVYVYPNIRDAQR